MSEKDQMASRIIIALDYPNEEEALALIRKLEGIPCYLKVGMELFYATGPHFVTLLKELGHKVFLDLKMHDIPNTVKGGAHSITKLGVDMFNVHASGGLTMMRAALEGVASARLAQPELPHPIVIAVTQLTSTSQQVLHEEIGIQLPIQSAVEKYAQMAKQAGLHGVVASPQEVTLIKQSCGADFITVTPGIRPAGGKVGDQVRVMTPKQAIAQGTNYMVIGRPITAAVNPREALEKIIEELIV